MTDTNGRRKDSDVQAAAGPPDPELESLIAPQGYDPDLVDDIATMESPSQQRRQGIKFLLIMVVILAIGFYFCTPANLIIPSNLDDPAPYGLDGRPTVPTDKFLEDVFPKTISNFTLVALKAEKAYEDPFIGADVVRATYVNEAGTPVLVVISQAESYINARRYLENYKNLLETQANVSEWEERLHIEDNYINWSAPGFADQAYGIAWNNDSHYISITSPVREAMEAMAAAFPY